MGKANNLVARWQRARFASLQKDPPSSVLKLDEGTNFGTDSVYSRSKRFRRTKADLPMRHVSPWTRFDSAGNLQLLSLNRTSLHERAWRGITSAFQEGVGRHAQCRTRRNRRKASSGQVCVIRPINACNAGPSTTCTWHAGSDGKRAMNGCASEIGCWQSKAHAAPWCRAESERNKQLAAALNVTSPASNT